MRVMLWHVHGSYTTALVQGPHEYLLPALPYRGPYGRGRAETWEWPTSAVEVTPQQAADADVDVVMLQRPEELDHLAEAWLGGRLPGATCRRSTSSTTPRRAGSRTCATPRPTDRT